ncbi:CRISPR-associated helicase Cas3' [Rubinisphaera margarita]|uniref:CRISPR-associated helicase Cas3' n=1 Tax=Rubinisphaera margarita TaxID=2909586 RepID=UPI001EE88229|nr:CRISPR-associated helicase Cas3' [Rubinisphaera margarita]MCG6157253.1 CRISPR-associated helicase Cas3' [Rubinisphaera margarita]
MRSIDLLAKNRDAELVATDSVYLAQHLKDVHAAAVAVIDATGSSQLAMLGLGVEKWLPRLKQTVRLAAAIHDLGKANDHFQGMLQPQELSHRNGMWQGLRHEWITVLMAMPDMAENGLYSPAYSLGNWLRGAVESDEDFLAVLWAVSGHHPKFGRPSPPRTSREGGGTEMRLLMEHDQFRHILSWLAEAFQLPEPKTVHERDLTVPLIGNRSALTYILDFYEISNRVWMPERHEQSEYVRFVAAVKNSLVAADIAGSALPQTVGGNAKQTEWIAKSFQALPTHDDLTQVILDRLNENRKTWLTPETLDQGLRPFQEEVGQSISQVTLVKAGCGTGKTLAAYEWARRQCSGKRLFFCYPTTGTATEGFRDYFLTPPQDGRPQKIKFEARLFHSRQEIDFDLLEIRETDGEQGLEEATETAIRIESLAAWSTPLAAATCDVVLGLMQNNRRGLYGWPAFAQAAFVFDEIHAYDDRLFGALLRFLKDVPGSQVLLMTASLPDTRAKAIERVLQRNGKSLKIIDGPEDLETLDRYHRVHEEYSELNSHSLLEQIRADLAAEYDSLETGKVLWVCNTVDRAIAAFEAALQADLPAIIYHSRFKYNDRVQRHLEVIQAFRGTEPVVAICTQVAEMSLDLSASLLVTDKAPVPSLIQRLGRLNRRARPDGHSLTKPFVLVNPTSPDGGSFHWPYTPEEFRLTDLWLQSLPSSGITQRHLSQAWEELPDHSQRRPAVAQSAWLDGGPTTQVLELRESTPGVTVILEEDAEKIRAGEDLGFYTIPMPAPSGKVRQQLLSPTARRIRGCFVVSRQFIDYDAKRGAQWRRNEP